MGVRPGNVRSQGVSRSSAQAPEGTGIEPAAGLRRFDEATGEGDEVATVADDDVRVIDSGVQLPVDPCGVDRSGVVGEHVVVARAR